MRNTFDMALLDELDDLNQRFARLLLERVETGELALAPGLTEALRVRLHDHGGRLPTCPFLLYRVTSAPPAVADAPGALRGGNGEVAALAALTLTFLWRLAREDLPVVRLVAGADAGWCDTLASAAPTRLAALAGEATLRARLVDVPGYWQDLVRSTGISTLQRASLGAAGLHLVMSRRRRSRPAHPLQWPDARAQHPPPD